MVETFPLVSVVSLDVDIYRSGQVEIASDKQAKVRRPGEGRGFTLSGSCSVFDVKLLHYNQNG